MKVAEWWDNLEEMEGDSILESLGIDSHDTMRGFDGDANGFRYLKPIIQKVLILYYLQKVMRTPENEK